MNTDIRLSVGFWQHPKTKKTVKRLGLEGIRSLQVLWLWAAVNRPDGVLSGMDWEDIELAADWQGDERAFFEFCLGTEGASMWIDEDESGYILHDWADHNPWQAEAEARSESARKAAKARWGNADASKAQCPFPFLSSPEEIQGGGVDARARVAESVPENPTHGPKKTDCPSKGNPQWAAFLSCWQVYPVKQGQEEAWREWMRLHGNGTLAEPFAIRDAILALAQEDSRWQRGKIRNMARWLNGKGWEDKPFREPSPPAAPDAITRARAPTEHQRRQQENRNMAVALLAAREQERQQNAENHGGNVHAGQAEIGSQAR